MIQCASCEGQALHQIGKRLYGAKVAVMGLAYKKNINDPRESPAIKIIEELVNLGAEVWVYHPLAPSIRTKARFSPWRGD